MMQPILNDWLKEQTDEIIEDNSISKLLSEFYITASTDDPVFYEATCKQYQKKILTLVVNHLLLNEADETPLLTRILDQLTVNWVNERG